MLPVSNFASSNWALGLVIGNICTFVLLQILLDRRDVRRVQSRVYLFAVGRVEILGKLHVLRVVAQGVYLERGELRLKPFQRPLAGVEVGKPRDVAEDVRVNLPLLAY